MNEPMTAEQIKAYLDGRSLTQALWWFIENTPSDVTVESDVFFYLRERYSKTQTT